MAINLELKRKTFSIPGVQVVDQQCGPLLNCCPHPDVDPEPYDCESVVAVPQTIIVTLSNSSLTAQHPVMFFTEPQDVTYCGNAWKEANVTAIEDFPDGSYELTYVGKFSGSEFTEACGDDTTNDDCDFHVYALSLDPVPTGTLESGGTTELLPAPDCCCDTGPQLWYYIGDDSYTVAYPVAPLASRPTICMEDRGSLKVPCDIDILYLNCTLATLWLSKAAVEGCIGDGCPPIDLPNGDTLGGLYCDTGAVAQYPANLSLRLFRQMIAYFPDNPGGHEECCSGEVQVRMTTYVARRRSLNDGVSVITNDTGLWGWTRGGTIVIDSTFTGSDTIGGEGLTWGQGCLVCDAYGITQTVDIDPGS